MDAHISHRVSSRAYTYIHIYLYLEQILVGDEHIGNGDDLRRIVDTLPARVAFLNEAWQQQQQKDQVKMLSLLSWLVML